MGSLWCKGDEDHGKGALLGIGAGVVGSAGGGSVGYEMSVEFTSVFEDAESESRSIFTSSSKSFSSKKTVSCSFPTLPPSIEAWLICVMVPLLNAESRLLRDDSRPERYKLSRE